MNDIKEDLINAVIALLEDGFEIDDITVRQIAYEAHVSTGLLNYHFKSKHKLIIAAVERIVDTASRRQYQTLICNDDTARTRLIKFLKAISQVLKQYDSYSKLLIQDELLSQRFTTPEVIVPLIEEIRPDLSPQRIRLLALQIVATFQYIFLKEDGFLGYMQLEQIDYDELIKVVFDQLSI